jgi:alcohol dehydrogenase
LTARFGIPHGQAIAVMLPHVIGYNGERFADWYAELHASVDPLADPRLEPAERVDALITLVRGFVQQSELAGSLDQLDVPRGELAGLADEAAQQWTAQFNPRSVGPGDLRRLYEAAYEANPNGESSRIGGASKNRFSEETAG